MFLLKPYSCFRDIKSCRDAQSNDVFFTKEVAGFVILKFHQGSKKDIRLSIPGTFRNS